jgi:hypothetical protein
MRFAIVALLAGGCFAQTAVDIAHQAKTPDFSSMPHTRPAQTGTALPGSCTAGEIFFKTDAAPGSNLYLATSGSPCTWIPAVPTGGSNGQIQYTNGGVLAGFSVSGDGTLTPSTGLLTVTKTNGASFAPSATTDATNASNIASGTLSPGRLPALGGDVSSGAGSASVTVTRINGTTVPTSSASDRLLGTSAPSTGSWFSIPNCQDGSGNHLNYNTTTHAFSCGTSASSGMVYPGAGLAVSAGSAWASPIVPGAAGHVVRSNGTSYVDSAIQPADIPVLNQDTTGKAATATSLAARPQQCSAGLYSTGNEANGNANCTSVTYSQITGIPSLPDGTAAVTQAPGDSTNKLATTTFVAAGLATKAASNASMMVNGQSCVLGSNCTIAAPSGMSGGYEVLKFVFGAGGNVNNGDTAQSNPPYRNTSLAGCFAHAETAPTTQALIIDILINGTSAYGTTNPKITINPGANDSVLASVFANSAIGPTTPPKAVVTQTGTGTPGAGITVVCGTLDSGVAADPDSTGAANSDLKVMSQKASNTALAAKENIANKGTASGYAPLDTTSKVPVVNLPAFQAPLGFAPENSANKGVVNGYAGLDASGKVPAIQLPPARGLVLLTDVGTGNTNYGASPTGCSASDLVDGFTFLSQPAHSSAGGATTFNYCGVSKSLVMQTGSNPNAGDLTYVDSSHPHLYQFVYLAGIDKIVVMQNLRMSSDEEANTGTDRRFAVNMPQVVAKIGQVAPLANNMGYRFQTARANGTIWGPSDPSGRPGSGRTYMEWFANGSSTLEGRRMSPAASGNCGATTASAISATAPRAVKYPTSSTTVGQSCMIGTSPTQAPAWAGGEEVFDATVQVSQTTGVSYLIGLIDANHVQPDMLSYTSGKYPAGWAGFRFNPGAGDVATWRCGMARDANANPVMDDAGGAVGSLTGSVIHFQMRLRESNGEAHFLVGPTGGSLTEVCTLGSWGGNMPTGVALTPFIAEYITGSVSAAPTIGIADVGLEVNAVPGAGLP